MIRFAKLLCLMLLSAFVFAQEPAQKMPDFDFVNVKGGHTTQADLDKNKKTLIVFFDATCPHCQKASAFFNMHLKELSKVNVLFVTLDEQKSINMFMQQYAPLIPNATNVKIYGIPITLLCLPFCQSVIRQFTCMTKRISYSFIPMTIRS